MLERINLDIPLVGVKVLKDSLQGYEGKAVFRGTSFCEAVKMATAGRGRLVTPASIEICKWSPAVLGLKTPAGGFQSGLEPRMEPGIEGYYVALLSDFSEDEPPDVVMLRARPAQMKRLVELLGDEGLIGERHRGQIGRTALAPQGFAPGAELRFMGWFKKVLASLSRFRYWHRFTRILFRSSLVTNLFEKMIRNTTGDMSVCRNSTVIPFLDDAANVSLFCTGAVAWGGNDPTCMTAGLPYRLFAKVQDSIEYPPGRS